MQSELTSFGGWLTMPVFNGKHSTKADNNYANQILNSQLTFN